MCSVLVVRPASVNCKHVAPGYLACTMLCMKRSIMLSIFALCLLAPTLVELVVYKGGHIDLLPVAKILVHFGIPLAFGFFVMRERLGQLWRLIVRPWPEQRGRGGMSLAALVALLAGAVIVGGYMMLGAYVDMSAIARDLAVNGITREVYPWIALWIIVVNPFKEEFFWRGFVLNRAYHFAQSASMRVTALVGTGVLFALHHIIIFAAWFNWWQFALATFFLSCAGVVLNYVYLRAGSIWAPWLVHTSADVALALLGFVVFGYITF